MCPDRGRHGPEDVHSVLTPAGEIESAGRFYRGLGPRCTKFVLFGTLSLILIVGIVEELRRPRQRQVDRAVVVRIISCYVRAALGHQSQLWSVIMGAKCGAAWVPTRVRCGYELGSTGLSEV